MIRSFLFALLFAAVPMWASAKPATRPIDRAHPQLPPQGGYASCGIEWTPTSCYSRLDEYATGLDGKIGDGFKYLANLIFFAACANGQASSGSCSNPSASNRLPAYLQYAAGDNMQIWGMLKPYDPNGLQGNAFVNTYPDFAASCNPVATTNQQFIACAAAIVANQPGWAGWIPDDEPGQDPTRAQVDESICNYIATVDPNHPCWLVQGIGGNQGNVNAQVKPYAWLSYLGGDYYPWGFGQGQSITQIGHQVAEFQAAREKFSPSMNISFTAQAFAWCQEAGPSASCVWPGEAVIKYERDSALANAPLWAVWYYSFDDVSCLSYYIPSWCNAKKQWSDLRLAAFSPPPGFPQVPNQHKRV